MALFGRKKIAEARTGRSARPSREGGAGSAAGAEQAAPPHGAPWRGRPLRLQYPPVSEHAAAHAERFAGAVQHVRGITLDYSLDSLAIVDDVLGGFEEDGSDAVAETVLSAGFYVGEVLVRACGWQWVELPPETTRHFGFSTAVRSPRGSEANPLGKVFKRVDNGPEDDIPYFVRVQLNSDAR